MMRAAEFLTHLNALPVAEIDAISTGRIMILAPHPDDETLGCGGLIAEACRIGQPPLVVILSDGAGSHPSSPSYPPERLRSVRAAEVEQAVAILGLPKRNLRLLSLPDTKLPHGGPEFDAVVAVVADLARQNGCRAICAPWHHDPHTDHEATDLIGRAAARMTGARLISYLVWGWFLPPDAPLPEQRPQGWRLNIETHLGAKKLAIAAHASQHAGFITDDPNGFHFPPALLSRADHSYEVYLSAS